MDLRSANSLQMINFHPTKRPYVYNDDTHLHSNSERGIFLYCRLTVVESRFFETPHSSNQKLFLLDLLESDFFLRFLELLIFQAKLSVPRRFEKSVFSRKAA